MRFALTAFATLIAVSAAAVNVVFDERSPKENCEWVDKSHVREQKVMTYNIRYSAGDRNSADNNWEARRDDLANLVESANPDVAGFQEVLPDQRKWLEARFPGYAFVGDGRNADRVNGEASPIAFRKDRFEPMKSGTFWLSETPDEPGSKSWKAAFPRICSYAVLKDKATGKTFAFANTHTDHRSEEAREKGMLLVIERMKEFSGGAPVVFVGDHSCLEYEKPAQAVAKILKDALYLSETPPEPRRLRSRFASGAHLATSPIQSASTTSMSRPARGFLATVQSRPPAPARISIRPTISRRSRKSSSAQRRRRTMRSRRRVRRSSCSTRRTHRT